MRIKPRKRPARADNAQIDSAAIGRAKIILTRLHQFASQARTLPPRLHAQPSKVTAFSPQFQVHASGKPMRISGNKKLPFFQVRPHPSRIAASAFDEWLLHAKRRTEPPREPLHSNRRGKTQRAVSSF